MLNSSLHNADDSAGDTAAGVSSDLGVRVIAPAVVVSHGVEDHGPADDVVAAVQLDEVVDEVKVSGLGAVELNVAEVADVTVLVMRMSVVILEIVQVTVLRIVWILNSKKYEQDSSKLEQ